jgi:hypothetical protein
MLGNNTSRIAICEKKERNDVVVVLLFIWETEEKFVDLLYRISKKLKS